MAEGRQLCTFYLGSECFGIDVTEVQEVLRNRELTAVPLAPAVIGGLINIRGDIGIAVDMGELIEGGARADAEGRRSTLLTLARHDGIGLLVDDSGDVVEVRDEDCQAPPETLGAVLRELLSSVCKLESGLVLALDTARLVARAEESVAAHFSAFER